VEALLAVLITAFHPLVCSNSLVTDTARASRTIPMPGGDFIKGWFKTADMEALLAVLITAFHPLMFSNLLMTDTALTASRTIPRLRGDFIKGWFKTADMEALLAVLITAFHHLICSNLLVTDTARAGRTIPMPGGDFIKGWIETADVVALLAVLITAFHLPFPQPNVLVANMAKKWCAGVIKITVISITAELPFKIRVAQRQNLLEPIDGVISICLRFIILVRIIVRIFQPLHDFSMFSVQLRSFLFGTLAVGAVSEEVLHNVLQLVVVFKVLNLLTALWALGTTVGCHCGTADELVLSVA